jgi:hypothetical protein
VDTEKRQKQTVNEISNKTNDQICYSWQQNKEKYLQELKTESSGEELNV